MLVIVTWGMILFYKDNDMIHLPSEVTVESQSALGSQLGQAKTAFTKLYGNLNKCRYVR